MLAVQKRGLDGIMNFAAPEAWPRYRMATSLARAMGADPGLVKKIRLYDIPAMAGRPCDTSMRCSRLQAEPGVSFMPLQGCIERLAEQYRPAPSPGRTP